MNTYDGYNKCFLGFIFFLLCNPYIKYFGFGTNTDVQLYPFVVSCFIILFSLYKFDFLIPKVLGCYFLFMVFMFIFFLFFTYVYYYTFLRGWFGYVSLLVNTLACYYFFKLLGDYSKIEKMFKMVFFIWVLVSIPQIINPDLFLFWRDKLITGGSRGAISLATEPAYYSIVLILLSLGLILINKRNIKYFYIAFLISALISKSSVGFLFCVCIFLFIYLRRFEILKILSFSLSVIFFIVIIFSFYKESRIALLLFDFVKNPLLLGNVDQSIGLRIVNIYVPLYKAVDNYFLPYGLSSWNYFLYEGINQYFAEAVWLNNISYQEQGSGRILSIHGQLVFEMGIFSIIFYGIIFSICKKVVIFHLYFLRYLFYFLMV